jgi:hypothetical protein
MFLRNVVIHTALQPVRPTTTSSPPWEPQITDKSCFFTPVCLRINEQVNLQR